MASDRLEEFAPIFCPKSHAVIGALDNVRKSGGRFLKALPSSGYAGKVYPVNAQESQVIGLKTYPRVTQGGARAVYSHQGSVEEKHRPQHSECEFNQDSRCTNVGSLFYGQVREPDAPVCSMFRRRDTELTKETAWDAVFRLLSAQYIDLQGEMLWLAIG